MLVASILTCTAGRLPAAKSRWKRSGNTMAKDTSPRSSKVSISPSVLWRGGRNHGARRPVTMRAVSADWSKSTTATGALCSSRDMPVAAA